MLPQYVKHYTEMLSMLLRALAEYQYVIQVDQHKLANIYSMAGLPSYALCIHHIERVSDVKCRVFLSRFLASKCLQYDTVYKSAALRFCHVWLSVNTADDCRGRGRAAGSLFGGFCQNLSAACNSTRASCTTRCQKCTVSFSFRRNIAGRRRARVPAIEFLAQAL